MTQEDPGKGQMKRSLIIASIVISLAFGLTFGLMACAFEPPSLWELKCAACHDGQTVLNDRVVPGKEQLKRKYPDLKRFANSCENAPSCMNILKHDKKLFIEVGSEIGIPGE